MIDDGCTATRIGGFPDAGELGFLCLGNSLDLALAAGEAAEALRRDFRAETLGTASADALFREVKGWSRGAGSFAYGTTRHHASRWEQAEVHRRQGDVLGRAEAVLRILGVEVGAAVGSEALASVDMLRRRVADGRRLQARIPSPARSSPQSEEYA